jgi:hypothetical protein
VAERLAAVARGSEAELALELLEAAAQQRHFLDRGAERLARPQAGMDPDSGDLAALADGDDERDRAGPGGSDRGLGCSGLWRREEGRRRPSWKKRISAQRSAGIGRLAGDPEQAERVGGLAVRTALDLVAEQGHRAVGEPSAAGPRPSSLPGSSGVRAHPRLHRGPRR